MKWLALTATLMLLVGVNLNVALAGPNAARTCAQLSGLKSVLPGAMTVGFRVRREIRPQAARAPIWPGRCGAFWTTYEGNGAFVDVSVNLYQTWRAVAVPLAEPGYGAIRMLTNGARVRTIGPVAASMNSAPASQTGVVSAYRNIFISSTSISLAKTPVPIAAQLRIHRAIETAFRSMG
jgi:hypothetical protein